MATKRIGALEIDADVRGGTHADALLHSYGANQTHGLRRTNEDKRKAVAGVLELMPDWSDRAIAGHVGVSAPFVAAVRDPAAADRQATNRKKTGCNPITPQGSTLPASEPPAKLADRAPGQVVDIDPARDDSPSLDDLIDELQRENKVLQAQVDAVNSGDPAAKAATYVRMYEDAVRKQSEEMDKTKLATDREAWTKKQLMRCGRAVGEDDPRRIQPPDRPSHDPAAALLCRRNRIKSRQPVARGLVGLMVGGSTGKEKSPSESITWARSWRRRRDSNPRYGSTVYRISSPAHSTTLPPLLMYVVSLFSEDRDSSLSRAQDFKPTQVGAQGGWQGDAAVGVLAVFQHGHQRAAHGQA